MDNSIDDDFYPAADEAVMKDAGERITKSLGKIPYQTSKHLCINTGLSIGTVVDWLDANGMEVYGEQVGNIWVYYLPENMPARLEKPVKLYFGGSDGRTICQRPATDRGNTGPLKKGQQVVLDLPKADPREQRSFSRSLPNIDLEEVERLAAIDPDTVGIAEELDVDPGRFRYELNHNIGLKKAYDRGNKIYMESKQKMLEGEPENEKQSAEVSEDKPASADAPNTPESSEKAPITRLELRKLLTPEYFEDAARKGKSTAVIAKEFGVGGKNPSVMVDGILYDTSHPEFRAAWKRGKALRAEDQKKSNSAPAVKKTRIKAESKSAATDFVIPEKKQEPKKAIELPEPAQEKFRENPGENSETTSIENEAKEPAIPGSDFARAVFVETFVEPEEENPLQPNPVKSFQEEDGACGWKQEEEFKVDPRFSHQLQHIGTHGHSREKIEEVKEKLVSTKMPFPVGDVEFLGRIAPAKKPGLNVEFNGDFFALTPRQRDLMCQMARLNDEFKQEEK